MPLVAFFDRYGLSLTDKQLRELQRWVYMALIWSRYSGSSETAMDQDEECLSHVKAEAENEEDLETAEVI